MIRGIKSHVSQHKSEAFKDENVHFALTTVNLEECKVTEEYAGARRKFRPQREYDAKTGTFFESILTAKKKVILQDLSAG